MKVTILVGTMTGTAQLCAQEMELALDDGETEVATLLMDGLDSSVFARAGGVPDLHLDLRAGRRARQRPRALRAPEVRAARTSRACATACSAWATAPTPRPSTSAASASTSILTELGAQRIGERHMHDASSGILPEETALEWCQAWLAKVKETQPA